MAVDLTPKEVYKIIQKKYGKDIYISIQFTWHYGKIHEMQIWDSVQSAWFTAKTLKGVLRKLEAAHKIWKSKDA